MPIDGINQSNWNYYLTVCMPPLTTQAAGYIHVCADSCNICSEDLKKCNKMCFLVITILIYEISGNNFQRCNVSHLNGKSLQSKRFQGGRPRLVSPIQYPTNRGMWSQTPLLFLSYGVEQVFLHNIMKWQRRRPLTLLEFKMSSLYPVRHLCDSLS